MCVCVLLLDLRSLKFTLLLSVVIFVNRTACESKLEIFCKSIQVYHYEFRIWQFYQPQCHSLS